MSALFVSSIVAPSVGELDTLAPPVTVMSAPNRREQIELDSGLQHRCVLVRRHGFEKPVCEGPGCGPRFGVDCSSSSAVLMRNSP